VQLALLRAAIGLIHSEKHAGARGYL